MRAHLKSLLKVNKNVANVAKEGLSEFLYRLYRFRPFFKKVSHAYAFKKFIKN